ncbi:helix-turn-helix transcriptional regulator [Candidatus Parcubacteria bacterium]|nr:helix-turn-helix transcriptional regulator [Candidatus Parcubacteria bacterium]
MNSKKIKLLSFDDLLKQELKNPEFKKGFELETKKLEMSLAIINLRKKKKISQAKLAEKIGMKQSAVGRIEAGKQNLTIETLQKIAFALNKELVVGFR